jgi:hypothetical protein
MGVVVRDSGLHFRDCVVDELDRFDSMTTFVVFRFLELRPGVLQRL